MKVFLSLLLAMVLHAGILLFGGLLFPRPEEGEGKLQTVDLLTGDETAQAKEKEKPKEKPSEEEKVEADADKPPDAAEVVRNLELDAAAKAPELEAASLSAIEAALSGQGSGGDFGQALSFSSGGVIGGTGKAGSTDEKLDGAFSLDEIDQKPRCVFQTTPSYPAEMRGKKADGVVTVIFLVDNAGKVSNVKVERSSHAAFERPALDAVKNWKFEPAVRGGERVACKMRITLRFQRS